MSGAADGGFDATCAVLGEIRRLLQEGPRPLALVGAGASIGSGYPTWSQLLDLFDERLEGKASPKWRQALKDLADPLWQAEEYREAMSAPAFKDVIARTFSARPPAEPHLTLARLPFRHFLTTNYDPTIEGALSIAGVKRPPWFTWDDEPAVVQFLRNLSATGQPQTVVYLHGRFHDPHRVVLTESGYAERYVETEATRRKLLAIFLTCPVVFLGFSMDDPDLSQLMREVASLASQGATHYAIMGYRTEDERLAIARRMEGKFHVRVAFYRIEPGEDHSALTRLLRWLEVRIADSGAIPPPPPPPPDQAAHSGAASDLIQDESGAPSGRRNLDGALSPGEAQTAAAAEDPLDPQKGRWGGSPKAAGFVLEAEEVGRHRRDYLSLTLRVRGEEGRTVRGKVVFHLHPTFPRSVVQVTARHGVAEIQRDAYGAFTVGAELLADGVSLELDLAQLEALPSWFRAR